MAVKEEAADGEAVEGSMSEKKGKKKVKKEKSDDVEMVDGDEDDAEFKLESHGDEGEEEKNDGEEKDNVLYRCWGFGPSHFSLSR